MQEAIFLEDLTKDYNGVRAVDNLTLSIEANHCVGFLGPNGAGKTTTIKILTNLLQATRGRAYLNGIEVSSNPKEALSEVGSVVEIPEFYPELTPNETLSYLGRLRGMDAELIEERRKWVIGQVKMEEWAEKRIGEFSRGMKQRIALAQALLHEPNILILDEPTSGLDPRGMAEVREIIIALKKQNLTIFMSSHLLYEVQQVCDKVAVIDRGKLVVYDDVENLSKVRKVLKIEVDVLKEIDMDSYNKVCKLPGVLGVQCPTNLKMFVDLEGDDEARANLLRELQEIGLKVYSYREAGIPLESLYMDLIKESR